MHDHSSPMLYIEIKGKSIQPYYTMLNQFSLCLNNTPVNLENTTYQLFTQQETIPY